MGSYYLKKLKNHKWSLYHQKYIDGKRQQERVSDLALIDLGFHPSDNYIKAYAQVQILNKENAKEKETIRLSAKRTEEFITLNEDLFPQQLVSDFKELLEDENFGSEEHLEKLSSHFNFIQQMSMKLKLDPSLYKQNSKRIYKYFIEKKISPSYCARIISILNRWGLFICRKRNKFFEAVPIPRGQQLAAISDAQKTKKGTDTALGVRTESLPLTPEILKKAKKFLSDEQFNWLKLSIWFGLRPEEVDLLHETSRFKIETVKIDKSKIIVLHVYQSKLKSVAADKRWKQIPVLFPEQQECLNIIKSGNFDRPLHKTVRKYCGRGITLYGGRKNFVDMMLGKKQKIEDISLWLGHTSIDTTWSHYKNKNIVSFNPTPEMIKSVG